jgi:hypothetical protein
MLNSNNNSATSGGNGNKEGLVSVGIDWFGKEFREKLVDFLMWLLHGAFDVTTPFVVWGCRIIIVWCIVTFYCSNDKRTICTAFKSFLVFWIFLMLRSVII